jgi:3-oxoacyl-[acyl-carrier protein] reductase
MDLKLAGKRALVTGSSAGIGQAIARLFAAEGALVTVHGRDVARAEAVAEGIRRNGGKAYVAVGTLSSEADTEEIAATAQRSMGGVDILINNAGGYGLSEQPISDWSELTPAHWYDTFRANLGGAAQLIRALVPGMKKQGWGRLVQIASVHGICPPGDRIDYASAKAGLINLSVSMAQALRDTGITSNTVTPGAIRSDGFTNSVTQLAKQFGWTGTRDDLERQFGEHLGYDIGGRVSDPEEVAAAVAYIASPLARTVNGANLRVDGGQTPSVN